MWAQIEPIENYKNLKNLKNSLNFTIKLSEFFGFSNI